MKNVAKKEINQAAQKTKSKFWRVLAVMVGVSLIGAGVWYYLVKNNHQNSVTGTTEGAAVGNAQTPTEAYQMLFAAVKSKETEKIKKMMSKDSLAFGEFAAAQQRKPLEEIFKNGFTATTFADSMPQIRDERIKENFGAVEVWNEKDKRWEDLPFMKEEGGWKLAVGNAFNGSFRSPGKGQAMIERENANAMNPNLVQAVPDFDGNFTSGKSKNANTGNSNTRKTKKEK